MSQSKPDPDACSALAIRWDEAPGLGSRIERARALEAEGTSCIGKGIYDARLAILYLDAGDLASAERTAKQGIRKGSPYPANLNQVLAEVALRRGNTERAYRIAQDIQSNYPAYAPILPFVYGIDVKRQDWLRALGNAQKWSQLDKGALPLLGMAAALHQLDRHEECIAMVYKALAIEPARIEKSAGLKEAIFSLGILKRNSEAADLLKRHIAANPDWRSDPSMVNAAKALGLIK